MKRFVRAMAWAGMLTLIACFPLWAASMAAEQTNPVQERYQSWTGVLRVWRCEGWQSGSGSLTSWLNSCIASFEKRHAGVYVQLIDVSEEEMRAYSMDMPNPPDLLIWAPGMRETPQGLLELTGQYELLDSLQEAGRWEGRRYAVPAALGGYALAINSQLLPSTPHDWREAQVVESRKSASTKQTAQAELFDMPVDTRSNSWSAAVISMFAGNAAQQGENGMRVGDGIDLGLSTSLQVQETPVPETEFRPNVLPAPLPSKFAERKSVYADFTGGYLAVMPVTQREIRRLEVLAKAPDWRVEAIGLPFTDQMALLSVIDVQRSDAAERQALCLELIDLMLSEAMQKKLTTSRAFPVREIGLLYPSNRAMSAVESALKSENLLISPAFGSEWREEASRHMAGLEAGESTQAAYEALKEPLRKK